MGLGDTTVSSGPPFLTCHSERSTSKDQVDQDSTPEGEGLCPSCPRAGPGWSRGPDRDGGQHRPRLRPALRWVPGREQHTQATRDRAALQKHTPSSSHHDTTPAKASANLTKACLLSSEVETSWQAANYKVMEWGFSVAYTFVSHTERNESHWSHLPSHVP